MVKVRLSQDKFDKLNRILMELELTIDERADAIRIAFAKGIDSEHAIDLNTKNGDSKSEIPISVVTRNNEPLYRHLIINKLGHPIDDYRFSLLVLAVIERGIEDMYNEIINLPDAESYLLYSVDKHKRNVI